MTPQQAIFFKKILKQERNLSLSLTPKLCPAAAAPAAIGLNHPELQSASCSLIETLLLPFPSRTPHPNLFCYLPIRGTSRITSRRLPPIHWALGIPFPQAPAKLPSFRQQTWEMGCMMLLGADASFMEGQILDFCQSTNLWTGSAVESAPCFCFLFLRRN